MILIFTFLFSTTCFAQSTAVYENQEYHFRFSYPSDWTVTPLEISDGVAVVVSRPDHGPGLTINALNMGRQFPPDMEKASGSLKHIINRQVSLVHQLYPGPQLIKQSIIKINNREAIYTNVNFLNYKTKTNQVFDTYMLFNSSYLYELLINLRIDVLNQNFQAYEGIINSFEILPQVNSDHSST